MLKTKRICAICFGVFVIGNANQRICDECKEYRPELVAEYKKERDRLSHAARQEKRKAAKTKRTTPINKIVVDINEYNKRHGTLLSYGKYVALMEMGKLKD